MAAKKKPDKKVDRSLGKPRTQAEVEKAHRTKPGTMEDLNRAVEHRPSVAEEKAAKEKAAAEAAAKKKAEEGGGCG